jgi:hypothetical protein
MECNYLGAEVRTSERGHPVRLSAKREPSWRINEDVERAARAGGQDARAPFSTLSISSTDLLQFALSKSLSDLIKNLELVFPKTV